MKKIGFLSFGHWQDVPGSRTRTAQDSLLQAIDIAVACEELGVDGAYFRVHHFARQQASPYPLLSAIASRTSKIEIGTGVIDMRYENPLYMAEEAAMADLISSGRLQLGISRGSPETAIEGYKSFGYTPRAGETDADMARAHARDFLAAIQGAPAAQANSGMTGGVGYLSVQPQSPGLRDRIWWGAGTRATAEWAAHEGMNLMSSTLLTEETGAQFDELQSEQITRFRKAWAEAGHEREPRVSVSRSIIPIIDDESAMYFGDRAAREGTDQVGHLDGGLARFGRSYIGEVDSLIKDLKNDSAIESADTLLITIPNQLGVDFNVRSMQAIVEQIAPAVGWR